MKSRWVKSIQYMGAKSAGEKSVGKQFVGEKWGEEFVGEKYMGEKPVGENLWMLLVILRFSVVSRFLAKVSVTCSWLEYLLAFVWDVAGAAICQTLDFSHTRQLSLTHSNSHTHNALSHHTHFV